MRINPNLNLQSILLTPYDGVPSKADDAVLLFIKAHIIYQGKKLDGIKMKGSKVIL